MTTTWKIGVDWRRKGVICWDAQPGDALNILPQPIRYTTLDWRTGLRKPRHEIEDEVL